MTSCVRRMITEQHCQQSGSGKTGALSPTLLEPFSTRRAVITSFLAYDFLGVRAVVAIAWTEMGVMRIWVVPGEDTVL